MVKLKPAEYWEWRTTLSELEISNLKQKNCELELKLLQKEVEIMNLKVILFRQLQVKNSVENVRLAKDEYDRYKKVLEDRHGVSFNNKMIDENTYEVKDLPNQNNNGG